MGHRARLFRWRKSRTCCKCFKYLQQGQTQIRIDERFGRTDRLTNDGWIPISFDSPSVEVPKDGLKRVSVTIVKAGSTPLCYTVDNDSAYVLKEVWVSLPVAKNSGVTKKEDNPLLLFLASPAGGFSPVGNRFVMCYDRNNKDFDISGWDALTAEVMGAQGWKQ